MRATASTISQGILRSVKSLRHIRILVCVLLLSLVISPEVVQAWYCDGHLCSIGALCCCESAPAQKDVRCAVPAKASSNAIACAANCRCQSIVVSVGTDTKALPGGTDLAVIHATVAILPTAYYFPAPISVALSNPESRGPQCSSHCTSTPSLRAPPIA